MYHPSCERIHSTKKDDKSHSKKHHTFIFNRLNINIHQYKENPHEITFRSQNTQTKIQPNHIENKIHNSLSSANVEGAFAQKLRACIYVSKYFSAAFREDAEVRDFSEIGDWAAGPVGSLHFGPPRGPSSLTVFSSAPFVLSRGSFWP